MILNIIFTLIGLVIGSIGLFLAIDDKAGTRKQILATFLVLLGTVITVAAMNPIVHQLFLIIF